MSNKIAPASPPRDITADISNQLTTLVNQTSDWIAGNILGIAIAAAVGTLIALALLGLRSVGARVVRKSGDNIHWRTVFGRALARTSLFFIVMTSAELVAEFANTPPALFKVIHVLFVISTAFQAAIWARELILGFVEHRIGPDTEHSSLASAKGIIRLLVSVALFAVALVLILDNLGVNVTGLVAGLGIGGIAIGLAAQGIFSDLFAALSIIFDKPFRRGDQVKFEEVSGSVEQIGLKTTRIRSLTGEQLIMANTKLLEREIHNMAAAKARRMTVYMAVSLKTEPKKLDRIPELAEAAVASRDGCKLVRCAANGVGSGAVSFELVYDDKAIDNNRTAANRSGVILNLVRNLQADKIELTRMSDISPPLAPF